MADRIVRSIGWVGEDGQQVFRAVIEYPNGPPDDLSFNAVWDARPVRIVIVESLAREKGLA